MNSGVNYEQGFSEEIEIAGYIGAESCKIKHTSLCELLYL